MISVSEVVEVNEVSRERIVIVFILVMIWGEEEKKKKKGNERWRLWCYIIVFCYYEYGWIVCWFVIFRFSVSVWREYCWDVLFGVLSDDVVYGGLVSFGGMEVIVLMVGIELKILVGMLRWE